MRKLTNIIEKYKADSIVAILKENGIEAYSKAPGSGGILDIKTGAAGFYGYDIFVDERKYYQAEELLEIFSMDETRELEGEPEAKGYQKRRGKLQRGMAILLIVVVLLLLASECRIINF